MLVVGACVVLEIVSSTRAVTEDVILDEYKEDFVIFSVVLLYRDAPAAIHASQRRPPYE